MKHILSEDDRTSLDQSIKEAEKRTQTQIVLATVKRCDNYAEIPWKAFALAASIAGLLVFLLNLLFTGWLTDILVIASVAAPLATGDICVLFTLFVPGFARLFLSADHAETETKHYAKSLFLERELFTTKKRTGVLLLISLFERQVVILPDKGLNNHLNANVLQNIITLMALPLTQNEVRLALETGLEGIIRVLEPLIGTGSEEDELSNEILEREGV